jgi:hypothetical protein
MHAYLSGAASAFSATAALFFLRYWHRSRDRFFAIWAASFGLLAAQWAVSAFSGSDIHAEAYLLRLGGFLMIVAGIIDKNRAGAGGGHGKRHASGVYARRSSPRPDLAAE